MLSESLFPRFFFRRDNGTQDDQQSKGEMDSHKQQPTVPPSAASFKNTATTSAVAGNVHQSAQGPVDIEPQYAEPVANHETQIECQCCYMEFEAPGMTKCENDSPHRFCITCVKRYAEATIGQGQTVLKCMDPSECGANFSEKEIKCILDAKTYRALERLRAEAAIREANIEGLVHCPFCDFAAIMDDPTDRIFDCQGCMQKSCRYCRVKSHHPLTCEKYQQQKNCDARHNIEEAMTAALVRNCNGCKKPFVKEGGCNRMYCSSCSNSQCFICSATVTDYTHFSNSTCPLNDDTNARINSDMMSAQGQAIKDVMRSRDDVTVEDLTVDRNLLPSAFDKKTPVPTNQTSQSANDIRPIAPTREAAVQERWRERENPERKAKQKEKAVENRENSEPKPRQQAENEEPALLGNLYYRTGIPQVPVHLGFPFGRVTPGPSLSQAGPDGLDRVRRREIRHPCDITMRHHSSQVSMEKLSAMRPAVLGEPAARLASVPHSGIKVPVVPAPYHVQPRHIGIPGSPLTPLSPRSLPQNMVRPPASPTTSFGTGILDHNFVGYTHGAPIGNQPQPAPLFVSETAPLRPQSFQQHSDYQLPQSPILHPSSMDLPRQPSFARAAETAAPFIDSSLRIRPYSYETGFKYRDYDAGQFQKEIQILTQLAESKQDLANSPCLKTLAQLSPHKLEAFKYEFQLATGKNLHDFCMALVAKEDSKIKTIVAGLTLGPAEFDWYLLKNRQSKNMDDDLILIFVGKDQDDLQYLDTLWRHRENSSLTSAIPSLTTNRTLQYALRICTNPGAREDPCKRINPTLIHREVERLEGILELTFPRTTYPPTFPVLDMLLYRSNNFIQQVALYFEVLTGSKLDSQIRRSSLDDMTKKIAIHAVRTAQDLTFRDCMALKDVISKRGREEDLAIRVCRGHWYHPHWAQIQATWMGITGREFKEKVMKMPQGLFRDLIVAMTDSSFDPTLTSSSPSALRGGPSTYSVFPAPPSTSGRPAPLASTRSTSYSYTQNVPTTWSL